MQPPLSNLTPLPHDAAAGDTAERPTEAAYWQGSVASRLLTRSAQKALGQFMTPPPIARFMAQKMVCGRDWGRRHLRLLDPAAGSGVLAAALVEALLSMPVPPASIELLMFEIDPRMRALLETSARALAQQCDQRGVAFQFRVEQRDFLLSELALSAEPTVDAVIANPPYFKLAGSDERARLHSASVHGQPNIYGLFMGSCAAILRAEGAFCFITPRSWTNGAYFRALRERLDESLSIQALHLFDSRKAHFHGDAVLQEALVTWASATRSRHPVAVSASAGIADLETVQLRFWPRDQIVGAAPERIVALPAAGHLASIASLPCRLSDLGWKVSTGPVVGFRARPFLASQPNATTVPMLWMQHVRPMQVTWPASHRAEHIDVSEATQSMLLRNRPMVVLRRFSPKENPRRIIAAPCLGDLPGSWVGLENHLNVVHSPEGSLSVDATRGLAAYFNCEPVDAHVRNILGSTQVNAFELRNLPLPGLATLERIGRAVAAGGCLEEAVSAHLCPFGTALRQAS